MKISCWILVDNLISLEKWKNILANFKIKDLNKYFLLKWIENF